MATNINLKGITELNITGITSPSVSNGVVSFTVPVTAPAGPTTAIQYNAGSGALGPERAR